MKRREWEPKKAMIVLQGLRGKAIADLCSEHQISQAQYYQWRAFWPIPTASLTNTPTRNSFDSRRERPAQHMIGSSRWS
ncbi:MAG: transposase [Elusimicrobia bacterium]|nr:transposase [Elusimicrobiota bacterium]